MSDKNGPVLLGVDFGTDSARALAVDALTGEELGSGVSAYARWAAGEFCDARENRFRQHPLDHLESLEACIKAALEDAGKGTAARVAGITVDTTGSTPCLADAGGTPLALRPGFEAEPDGMFILWKDHMAVEEAAQINATARGWGGTDYTSFEGGIYSSEWFWAKALRVAKTNLAVSAAARTVVEHCDWLTAVLCGMPPLAAWKRSRTAAGHKAMWHASWGGYPRADFLAKLHPRLADWLPSLGTETYTHAERAGTLCAEWAGKLGLREGVAIGVGSFDAHAGAVGAMVAPGTLVKIMGTSTCDITVGARPSGEEKLVRGICGQVDGSVVPGMIGYEAGQSAFGDIFAWFRKLLAWSLAGTDAADRARIEKGILPALEKEAVKLGPLDSGLVALDWLNGRRTPDADQSLTAAVAGIGLGTDAPAFYRALVDGAAFGARAIVDRLREEGVPVERVSAIGGVARKSPFVMQASADALGMEIEVAKSDQSCALGAAMLAAVAAGIHADVAAAQKAMGSGAERTYRPDPARRGAYEALYKKYKKLGAFAEGERK